MSAAMPGVSRDCVRCDLVVTLCPHGWQAPFHAPCVGGAAHDGGMTLYGRPVGGSVHGFVFEMVRYSGGRVIAREHPAYCRADGSIAWAPNREHWRDAPADVAASFLPAGDAARSWMLELQRRAAADGAVMSS